MAAQKQVAKGVNSPNVIAEGDVVIVGDLYRDNRIGPSELKRLERMEKAGQNVSWKHAQKPNGMCPVCGTTAEKILASVLLAQAKANHACWPRIQDGVALTDCRQPTEADMPKTAQVECKNQNCRVMFGMDVTR